MRKMLTIRFYMNENKTKMENYGSGLSQLADPKLVCAMSANVSSGVGGAAGLASDAGQWERMDVTPF
jgi:hypothetical protein